MSDMSTIRKKLFGYRLIKTQKVDDISYGGHTPMTQLIYRSRSGRIVVKYIYGYHTLEELETS